MTAKFHDCIHPGGCAADFDESDSDHPANDQQPITDELVRTITDTLKNPTAWRVVHDGMYGEQEVPQYAIDLFAEERARNVVAWLVAEFEMRRRT